jgi:hypothetical protein
VYERLDESAGDGRSEQGVPVCHVADGNSQLLRSDGFQEEAAGTGPHGFVDVLVEVEGGEDEDFGGSVGYRPAGGLDPVQLGHPNVHQCDVGPQPDGQVNRLLSIRRLTDDGESPRVGWRLSFQEG